VFSSIAARPDGQPRIAYSDETGHHLKYTQRTVSGQWLIELVDDGDVGLFTSLTFDHLGMPHIVFDDYIDHLLIHAYPRSFLYLPAIKQ